MMGHSQEELVAMLRSTKQGERVCVVVARQEDLFLPRELVRESDWTNTNVSAIKKTTLPHFQIVAAFLLIWHVNLLK